MKIAIVNNYKVSEQKVIANRFQPLIDEGINRGIKFFHIGPKDIASISKNNIEKINLELDNAQTDNFMLRAFLEIKNSMKLVKAAQKLNADLYIFTIPSMFLLPFSLLIKNKSIVDVRDLTWEYLPKKKIYTKVLKFLMDLSLKQSKKILVSNQAEFEYINNLNSNVISMSNGISSYKFKELSIIPKYNQEPIQVTYIGNIGLAQNLKVLLKVAKERPKVIFNIVGNGTQYKKLQRYANKLQLENVKFYGQLPWTEVIKIYRKSSVLYAQLSDDYATAFPSKLYEYLSTGLPIIYGGKGYAIDMLKKFENVITIKPDSEAEIIESIDNLKVDTKKSKNNFDLLKRQFLRENIANKVLDSIL